MQLGENPKTIYNVGSLGVENIYKTKLLNKSEIEKIFKIIEDQENVKTIEDYNHKKSS